MKEKLPDLLKVPIRQLLYGAAMVLLSFSAASAQEVRGKITDENNGPLPGVSVIEKGTTNGTVTDADGIFAITTNNPEAVLVISFIGYRKQEIAVAGKTEINVILNPDVTELETVIVTGYRSQTRGSITGSVSSVTSSEFQDMPVDNLSNALAGRLSGVRISQNAGTPGRESNVVIRAIGTTNNSEPLYVIDGVINDKFAFDGLSPNEIESVVILKDGASAAIYGSRAANGVVLVTTKRGTEGAPKLSYNGSVGMQTPTRIAPGLNAFQHATLINDALAYNNIATTDARYYTEDELEYFKTNSWDWVEELWRDPINTQHALNVSGGSPTVNYFLGGSYNYFTGSFDNLDFQKINIRGNVDVKITKNLTASLDMSTDNRATNGPSWGGTDWTHEDLYKALVLRSPMVPPFVNGLPTGNWVEWHPGAVISGISGYHDRNWKAIETKLGLTYNVPFVEGLSAKVMYNQYRRDEEQRQFNLPYNMTVFNTGGGHNHIVGDQPVSLRPRSEQQYLRNRRDQMNRYQFDAQLNYQHTFGNHTVDALFVYEQAETDLEWIQSRKDNFISPSVDQFVGGRDVLTGTTGVSGAQEQTARISYVGLLGYNFKDRYMIEGSFRYDASHIFPPDGRWGFFPSLSAGWRISNESFFGGNFFDDLKLRLSYGLLGNDQVSPFQGEQFYNITDGAIFDSKPSFGLVPGVLANPNITWEKSKNYNIGLDSRFFTNKISLKLDVFYRNTYDILGSRQYSIPSTFGGRMPDENYQEIDSRGFEIELGYDGRIGNAESAPKFFIEGNFGYATNEIVKLDEGQNTRPYQSKIGRAIALDAGGNVARNTTVDMLFGYIATDIIRTQEDLDALPAGYTILGEAPRMGMLNYKDLRGPNTDEPDGRITADDQVFLGGYSIPPMNYGLSLGLSWKALTMEVLFQGLAGHKTMIHANARRVQGRAEEASYGFWADHWTPENTEAAYPAARRPDWPPTDYPASSWFMRDASFVRLKNVNISYGLPKKVSNALHVTNVRLFFTGTNLFLLYDKMGDFKYDPEARSIRAYPIMKTLSLGLNVNL